MDYWNIPATDEQENDMDYWHSWNTYTHRRALAIARTLGVYRAARYLDRRGITLRDALDILFGPGFGIKSIARRYEREHIAKKTLTPDLPQKKEETFGEAALALAFMVGALVGAVFIAMFFMVEPAQAPGPDMQIPERPPVLRQFEQPKPPASKVGIIIV